MRDPDARHKVPAAKTVDAGRSHDHAIDAAELGEGFTALDENDTRDYPLDEAQAPQGPFTDAAGKHHDA